MTDPYGLQRALDDFYETLDSLRFQSVSQLAELAKLKVLIHKYPDHARQMLDEEHQPPTGSSR